VLSVAQTSNIVDSQVWNVPLERNPTRMKAHFDPVQWVRIRFMVRVSRVRVMARVKVTVSF